MCLILLAIKKDPLYKLILAANRDEYYERPTAQASFWKDAPYLLAGRDLRGGGTWLGITRNGRIAAITNYRDPASVKKNAPSRGKLVSHFLLGSETPADYIHDVARKGDKFNGFNLIVGEKDELYWYSNRSDESKHLSPCIYGLSNHLLDTSWPKVTRGKDALARLLAEHKKLSSEELFHILGDRTIANDENLPNTGVGLEWERILSSIYISSPDYGTRSSTLLLIDHNDRVTYIERTFNSDPEHATSLKYEFWVESQNDTIA
ncbi:MAG: NRDE family protein [Thermodesulfobacteriota bacterium]|nr:NRDE family protein [Thermodesulfobacteriota bacterium]